MFASAGSVIKLWDINLKLIQDLSSNNGEIRLFFKGFNTNLHLNVNYMCLLLIIN